MGNQSTNFFQEDIAIEWFFAVRHSLVTKSHGIASQVHKRSIRRDLSVTLFQLEQQSAQVMRENVGVPQEIQPSL